MANVGLPHASIREAIAFAIHTVVHLDRVDDRRRVTQIVQVRGYDTAHVRFDLDTRSVEVCDGASPGVAA